MNQCKKCAHKSDCWIKQVINDKLMMPDSPRDQDLCIQASLGKCVMFDSLENFDSLEDY